MCQNHVGQLIWHLNIEASERDRSCYCHKPIVQRWTTPFHGGVDGGDVEEVGEVMSMHASVLVDSVGPPSVEVCRTATSFP
jgi:hypothetical protein